MTSKTQSLTEEARVGRALWSVRLREAARAILMGSAVGAAYLVTIALLLWPVLDAL